MYKYPKIESLFKRDENFKVTNEIRLPEFKNIKNWLITEKIDGTNIRIIFKPKEIISCLDEVNPSELLFRGRTDNAQMPTFLHEVLSKMFKVERFKEIFPTAKEVCLYGEGYGAKIQKGGGNYNKSNSFRLFDIWIDGWWLEWDSVKEIAEKLGIKTAPVIMVTDIKNAIGLVEDKIMKSRVALEENKAMSERNVIAEGIVARAYPMMLFRNGLPIKWKLKVKDYD